MPKKWDEVVNLTDLYQQFEEDALDVNGVARSVAARLKKTKLHQEDYELQSLVEELETVTEQDEYDDLMNTIYDIADAGKRLWLEIGL